jgi:hypothetical protein
MKTTASWIILCGLSISACGNEPAGPAVALAASL